MDRGNVGPASGPTLYDPRSTIHARIRGSHHIFTITGAAEILNLQPRGAQAKPYQVKQVRKLLLKYRLEGEADDSV